MAVKKYKPQSPDPYVGKIKGDTEFARLAHLNDLVDQVNNNSGASYKSYVAKIYQNSTSAPVITVVENTTGLTLNWTRAAVGRYITNTITGDGNKITITCSPGNQIPVGICIYSSIGGAGGSNIYFQIESFANYIGSFVSTVGPNDSILTNATIEIRIYP
jgi:hypothetical protein